jgi:hypothetical protein
MSNATIKKIAQPSRFLLLPNELRKKVYKELLSEFTGDTSPLRGAPLSSIQAAWNTAFSSSALRTSLLGAKVSISIPKPAFLHPSAGTNPLVSKILAPILDFRVESLEVSLYEDSSSLAAKNAPVPRHMNTWHKILYTACGHISCLLWQWPSPSNPSPLNIQPRSISFSWSRADAFPVNSALCWAHNLPVADFGILLNLFKEAVPGGFVPRYWGEDGNECWMEGEDKYRGIGYENFPVRMVWTPTRV